MGRPVPTPPAIGGSCPTCDGELWPVGETPQYLRVTVSGISACPAVPDPAPAGVWIIQQEPLTPCIWTLSAGLYDFLFRCWADRTTLSIWDSATHTKLWLASKVNACWAATYISLLVTCTDPQNYGTHGQAIVEFDW